MNNPVHILLFGKSGSGKSTITNALLRGNIVETGDGLKGVTIRCKTVTNNLHNYYITDTIGIGETDFGSIPHERAVEHLENFLTTLTFPINHVCFVKESGTFDAVDEAFWKVFSQMFNNCKPNYIMIITKSRPGWAEENKHYINGITGNIPLIDVNFPDVSNDMIEERIFSQMRQNSLEHLENTLLQIRNKPGYSPLVPRVNPSMAKSILNIFSGISNIGKKKKIQSAQYHDNSNPIFHIQNICQNHMLPNPLYRRNGEKILRFISSLD